MLELIINLFIVGHIYLRRSFVMLFVTAAVISRMLIDELFMYTRVLVVFDQSWSFVVNRLHKTLNHFVMFHQPGSEIWCHADVS